jgi:hypothetical protein
MVPLEADFTALLALLAGSSAPVGSMADWFDRHRAAFGGQDENAALREAVQVALAICWRAERRRLSDQAARVRLGRLADELAGRG